MLFYFSSIFQYHRSFFLGRCPSLTVLLIFFICILPMKRIFCFRISSCFRTAWFDSLCLFIPHKAFALGLSDYSILTRSALSLMCCLGRDGLRSTSSSTSSENATDNLSLIILLAAPQSSAERTRKYPMALLRQSR